MCNLPTQAVLCFCDSIPASGLNFGLLIKALSLQCVLHSPSEP